MEELQLIEGISLNDRQAIEVLYTTFSPKLCLIAKHWIDDEEDIIDIVGDCFLEFISMVKERKIDLTQSPNIQGLLYTIVKNQSIDHIRARKRKKTAIDEISYLANIQNVNDEWTLRHADIYEKLYREIEKLPARRKEIIKMFLSQQFSIEDIAKQQGVSYNTVRNQKNKALEALRLAFSNEEWKIILLVLSVGAFSLN